MAEAADVAVYVPKVDDEHTLTYLKVINKSIHRGPKEIRTNKKDSKRELRDSLSVLKTQHSESFKFAMQNHVAGSAIGGWWAVDASHDHQFEKSIFDAKQTKESERILTDVFGSMSFEESYQLNEGEVYVEAIPIKCHKFTVEGKRDQVHCVHYPAKVATVVGKMNREDVLNSARFYFLDLETWRPVFMALGMHDVDLGSRRDKLEQKLKAKVYNQKIPMGGFDPKNKSAELVISDHGRIVSGPFRNSAICKQELTEGKHKFWILAGKDSWIGFARSRTKIAPDHRREGKEEKLGWRGHCWEGYSYCYDGDIGHKGKKHSGKRAPRIVKGDIVAAEIDLDALTITYWHNGNKVWYVQPIEPANYKAGVTMGSPSTIMLLDEESAKAKLKVKVQYEVTVSHNEDAFGSTKSGNYTVKMNGDSIKKGKYGSRGSFMGWLSKMRGIKTLGSGFGVSGKGPWNFEATRGEWESYWEPKFNNNW